MSSPALPRPRSHRLKLDRAKAHFESLKRNVDAFLETRPYGASINLDAKASEYQLIGRVNSEAPPEIGPIIGDFLFNLRSALDHLAYELVLANSGTPSDRTAFPIFADGPTFRQVTGSGTPSPRSGLYKMIGMSTAAQSAIEALQPYHGLNGPPKRDPLWLLHDFNNVDKHRTHHVVAAAVAEVRIRFLHSLAVLPNAWEWELGPFVDGQILARLKVSPLFLGLAQGDPQVQFNGQGTFSVTFAEEPDPVSLSQRLGAIGEYSESVILTLEPYL